MFGHDAGPGIFDWISNKSCNYWEETFFVRDATRRHVSPLHCSVQGTGGKI